MATHFETLTLDRPDLFGVKLSGTVSPSDRGRLRELAEKCLEHEQVRVIIDLSGLGALGGGGATALADFQSQLLQAGGGCIFVGVGEVMRHFLEQKFVDVPLVVHQDVEAAVAAVPESESGSAVGVTETSAVETRVEEDTEAAEETEGAEAAETTESES